MMKKVAVFGNAGGGKSILARKLSEITGLPLYSLDKIKYQSGGIEISHEEYLHVHSDLLNQEEWIIDGCGGIESAWERFSKADTLIYIDLPLLMHYWWVTKRLFQGMYKNPEGWPEYSPIWKGSLNSFRVLPLCHRRLTPRYRQLVKEAVSSKRVHHLRSLKDIGNFLCNMLLGYKCE